MSAQRPGGQLEVADFFPELVEGSWWRSAAVAVRLLRELQGLSVAQLAERSGVRWQHLERIERRLVAVDEAALTSLLEAMDVAPELLLALAVVVEYLRFEAVQADNGGGPLIQEAC
jgi:transcriptional regulator with XRE-family HTH domain